MIGTYLIHSNDFRALQSKSDTVIQLRKGIQLTDEDIVSIVIAELEKNDKQAKAHILINFPKNERQTVIFEQRISGYKQPVQLIPGDLKRVALNGKLPENKSLLTSVSI